jgi:hypothetical protein
MFKKDCASSIEVYDCWRGKSSVRPTSRLVTAAGTSPATSGRIAAERSSLLLPIPHPHQQRRVQFAFRTWQVKAGIESALPLPCVDAHGGDQRVPSQQGTLPGADVRETHPQVDRYFELDFDSGLGSPGGPGTCDSNLGDYPDRCLSAVESCRANRLPPSADSESSARRSLITESRTRAAMRSFSGHEISRNVRCHSAWRLSRVDRSDIEKPRLEPIPRLEQTMSSGEILDSLTSDPLGFQ